MPFDHKTMQALIGVRKSKKNRLTQRRKWKQGELNRFIITDMTDSLSLSFFTA